MNLLKYNELREKFKVKNFEKKHADVDKWLYRFSFFGNAASIFFAYFLIQPMLYKKLIMYMGESSLSMILSFVITVGVLTIFEILKRKMFSIFASDYITAGRKITNAGMGFAIGSLLIIGGSYYFSISGAIKLSNSSTVTNQVIVNNNQKMIDSLSLINEKAKTSFLSDNEKLREANTDLRSKIAELGSHQRTAMTTYNNIIKDNLSTIEFNNREMATLDEKYRSKVAAIEAKQNDITASNINEDQSSYIVFLSISTLIELLIVVGLFYRELYEFKIFEENETKLEMIHRKIERYENLLKMVFKNGEVHQDTQVVSVAKLFELAKVRFGAGYFTQKNIEDFYQEMTHIGAFKIVSKKRYAALSFEDSVKLLDKLHDA